MGWVLYLKKLKGEPTTAPMPKDSADVRFTSDGATLDEGYDGCWAQANENGWFARNSEARFAWEPIPYAIHQHPAGTYSSPRPQPNTFEPKGIWHLFASKDAAYEWLGEGRHEQS